MERRKTQEYPHPFVHEIKLTTAQRIRGQVLGAVLFPVRVTFAALCFLLMWPFARLRLLGLTKQDREKPIKGWRFWLFNGIVQFLSRAVFFCVGFLWIRVKGRRAGGAEAPVLAVAPHSGFLDMVVLCFTSLATVVSRSENTSLPVIGALLEFNQAVLVNRKDPESRKKCVSQITERVTSNGHWPQMLMFPEGTTTNGSALIKFKPGAFLAGVPVQPVLLHYPNKLDTVRWTWKGTSWLQSLWHTTSQLYSSLTIEFLPVYTPSQAEKDDPNLYADNVQKLMAKGLGVPATDYVMEGRYPVKRVGGLSLPLESPATETLKLLHNAGLSRAEVHAALGRMTERCLSGQEKMVSVDQLQQWLGLSDREPAQKISSLFSKDERVDLRLLCLSLPAVSGLCCLEDLMTTAFRLYDADGDGVLSAGELAGLMGALVGVPQYRTAHIYTQLTSRGQANKDGLISLLTSDPTYQELLSDYLHPKGADLETSAYHTANGKDSNHNGSMQNGNVMMNGDKKTD
ncbi:lysophospholipid acyltransferase LPCAT4 [Engraulis encrasicolus]|uniref:lysophospholipid acyltransferase LPCAT4 n=1 Tax=Engraulis encrasicolus TaxID=184585 RepID=UPI002FD4930A